MEAFLSGIPDTGYRIPDTGYRKDKISFIQLLGLKSKYRDFSPAIQKFDDT